MLFPRQNRMQIMTSINNNRMCHEAINSVISENATTEQKNHVCSCDFCKSQIGVISAIKATGSLPTEDFSALKGRILKKLAPIMEEKKLASKSPQTSSIKSWFSWGFGAALAGAFLVLMLSNNPHIPKSVNTTINPANSTSLSNKCFQIAINNENNKTISLDNPVSIFEKETALITIPDGSKIKAVGPARLSIMERGFHILNGKIEVSVVPGKKKFVGTTPHGQITVLGTVFSCDVTSDKSDIFVTKGKVRVDPDNGKSQILTAGQKIAITTNPSAILNLKEKVPPIATE
jgi:hypothetical protein